MDLLSKYKAMIKTPKLSPLSLVVDNSSTTEEKKKERKNSKNAYRGNGDNIDKTLLWENPFPQGIPEARKESLRVIEPALRGEPIPYYGTSELPPPSFVVANRPFTEKIVHITKTNPTKDKKTKPQVKGSAVWPPEVQSLVDWFLAFDPPKESFYLVPHLLINNPMKFFQSLRLGIETGPKGPRARRGALQWDLRQLKAYFSEERSPEA